MRIKVTLLSVACAALCIFGLGSSCPGEQGNSARFTNKTLSDALTRATSSEKSWRTPQFLDQGGLDSSTEDNNTAVGAGTNRYPMAVIYDADESFYVAYNRGSAGDVLGYLTQPASFLSDLWAYALSYYTQADAGQVDAIAPFATGTSIDSQKPMAVVDSSGNVTVVYLTTEETTTFQRPFGIRHTYGSSAWGIPYDLRVVDSVNAIRQNSAAMAVDAYNDVVVVWCQGTSAHYNEFRPFSGWRFTTAVAGTFHSTESCSSSDLGMDVAFHPTNGKGYGAFVEDATSIIWLMPWASDNWTTASLLQITGTSNDAFPRLFIDSSGVTTLFFYRNYSFAGSSAELYYSVGSTSSTAGFVPSIARFDGAVGTGLAGTLLARDGDDPLKPILAYKGDTALLAFIKDSGATLQLWVSGYGGNGAWSTPEAIDGGVAGNHVTWADAAVNANGEAAVVWSAVDTNDGGNEHVYGRVYRNSAWQDINQLDTVSTFVAGSGAAARYRPSVSMDSAGNAVATFSIDDSTIAGPTRRSIAVSFR